jgi:hypothetical protein
MMFDKASLFLTLSTLSIVLVNGCENNSLSVFPGEEGYTPDGSKILGALLTPLASSGSAVTGSITLEFSALSSGCSVGKYLLSTNDANSFFDCTSCDISVKSGTSCDAPGEFGFWDVNFTGQDTWLAEGKFQSYGPEAEGMFSFNNGYDDTMTNGHVVVVSTYDYMTEMDVPVACGVLSRDTSQTLAPSPATAAPVPVPVTPAPVTVPTTPSPPTTGGETPSDDSAAPFLSAYSVAGAGAALVTSLFVL